MPSSLPRSELQIETDDITALSHRHWAQWGSEDRAAAFPCKQVSGFSSQPFMHAAAHLLAPMLMRARSFEEMRPSAPLNSAHCHTYSSAASDSAATKNTEALSLAACMLMDTIASSSDKIPAEECTPTGQATILLYRIGRCWCMLPLTDVPYLKHCGSSCWLAQSPATQLHAVRLLLLMLRNAHLLSPRCSAQRSVSASRTEFSRGNAPPILNAQLLKTLILLTGCPVNLYRRCNALRSHAPTAVLANQPRLASAVTATADSG